MAHRTTEPRVRGSNPLGRADSPQKPGIHYGRPESSPRLQRVLEALRRHTDHGISTRGLIQVANVCAVNTCIAELRAAGYEISCDLERTNADGSRVYRYRLVSETGKEAA